MLRGITEILRRNACRKRRGHCNESLSCPPVVTHFLKNDKDEFIVWDCCDEADGIEVYVDASAKKADWNHPVFKALGIDRNSRRDGSFVPKKPRGAIMSILRELGYEIYYSVADEDKYIDCDGGRCGNREDALKTARELNASRLAALRQAAAQSSGGGNE